MPWAWIKAVNDIVTQEPWDPPEGRLPVQLLPWLWLSDHMHVQQANTLMELGITHVLSTNAMFNHELNHLRDRLQRVGIQHDYVKGRDEERYDMIGLHWEKCREILLAVKEAGGRIVVHCVAGTNRSGLIACAAVMHSERLPVLDVVQLAKAKRGMILTNLSFQRQLCELAAREELLGDRPEGYTDDPVADIPPPPSFRDAFDSVNH